MEWDEYADCRMPSTVDNKLFASAHHCSRSAFRPPEVNFIDLITLTITTTTTEIVWENVYGKILCHSVLCLSIFLCSRVY